MAYAIHIERRQTDGIPSPIGLEEWRKAVDETAGVRIIGGPVNVQDPATGQIVMVPNSGGDAEIHVTGDNWRRIFFWRPSGCISFPASDETAQPDSEIRRVARVLAQKLSAVLVGDGGEIYE